MTRTRRAASYARPHMPIASYDALVRHADELRRRGACDEAVRAFHSIAQRHPQRSDAFANLGAMLQAAGHPMQALHAITRAMELDPQNVSALLNSAEILKDFGEWETVRDTYDAALTLQPDSATLRFARALHLLARIPGKAAAYVARACSDADPQLRTAGLRLAAELGHDPLPLVQALVADQSAMVRRQCALSLRQAQGAAAGALWAELAVQHDGTDRWHLEALGIGADRNADACFAAWRAKVGDAWNTPGGRDIVWRSRSEQALDLLVAMLKDETLPEADHPRWLRAFDFHSGPAKAAALKRLLE